VLGASAGSCSRACGSTHSPAAFPAELAAARLQKREDVVAKTTISATFDLPAGEYVMFCNVVDAGVSHYGKGMHTRFTVK
jgi:hypothetical protein